MRKRVDQTRQLKARIQDLEGKLHRVEVDRQKLRDHFAARFNWHVDLLKNGRVPILAEVVREDARLMHRLDWWSF